MNKLTTTWTIHFADGFTADETIELPTHWSYNDHCNYLREAYRSYGIVWSELVEQLEPTIEDKLVEINNTLDLFDEVQGRMTETAAEFVAKLQAERTDLMNKQCELGTCDCGRIQLVNVQRVRVTRAATDFTNEGVAKIMEAIETCCYNGFIVRMMAWLHDEFNALTEEELDKLFWDLYEAV